MFDLCFSQAFQFVNFLSHVHFKWPRIMAFEVPFRLAQHTNEPVGLAISMKADVVEGFFMKVANGVLELKIHDNLILLIKYHALEK